MAYQGELILAKTVLEIQKAYDRECQRRMDDYSKKYGKIQAERMILEDFEIWKMAQERLHEIFSKRESEELRIEKFF